MMDGFNKNINNTDDRGDEREVRFGDYLDKFYNENPEKIDDIGYKELRGRAERNMRDVKNHLYPTPAMKKARLQKNTVRVLAFAAAIVLVVLPVMFFAGVIQIPGFNAPAAVPETGAAIERTQGTQDQVSVESSGADGAAAQEETSKDVPEASYDVPAESSEAPAAGEPEAPAETEAPMGIASVKQCTVAELAADERLGAYIPVEAPDGMGLESATLSETEEGSSAHIIYTGDGCEVIADISINDALQSPDGAEVITVSSPDMLTEELLESASNSQNVSIIYSEGGVMMNIMSDGVSADVQKAFIISAHGWFK